MSLTNTMAADDAMSQSINSHDSDLIFPYLSYHETTKDDSTPPWIRDVIFMFTGARCLMPSRRDEYQEPGHSAQVHSLYSLVMMTSSNGKKIRVTGHLCGEFTGHRRIPHTRASDAEFWFFFGLRLNKCLRLMNLDAIAPIMTSS